MPFDALPPWHRESPRLLENAITAAHAAAAVIRRRGIGSPSDISMLSIVMKRFSLVRRVLTDCYCRLRPSSIHGIGVFAIRDIPRGRNPFATMRRYARPGYVRITKSELSALPIGLAQMIRELFVPTDESMWLPTSGMNIVYLIAYLNHSETPNLRSTDGFNFYSRRKVYEGEELTVDYRTYGADHLLSS